MSDKEPKMISKEEALAKFPFLEKFSTQDIRSLLVEIMKMMLVQDHDFIMYLSALGK